MLARRQEINTQVQVLIDGFLPAVSLWVALVLRYYSAFWFNLRDTVAPFHNYHCLFIVIMPFRADPARPAGILSLAPEQDAMAIPRANCARDDRSQHHCQRLRHLSAPANGKSQCSVALYRDRHDLVAG